MSKSLFELMDLDNTELGNEARDATLAASKSVRSAAANVDEAVDALKVMVENMKRESANPNKACMTKEAAMAAGSMGRLEMVRDLLHMADNKLGGYS